jgi:hypothetical protein
MNISKIDQRILHALAQGGYIRHDRDPISGRIVDVCCFTRDGYVLSDCTLPAFKKLKRKGLIESHNGMPYRISRFGIECVRPQLDNR